MNQNVNDSNHRFTFKFDGESELFDNDDQIHNKDYRSCLKNNNSTKYSNISDDNNKFKKENFNIKNK